jgi:D-glycero-D-manno-heptose 1,7-bisphosphate phosphatase
MKKAVFIDKDGTLIEDVPYNCNVARMRLMPGASAGLRVLHDAGYALIVISNQAGVALGHFPEESLKAVETYLQRLLADAGVPLDGFYYCPHHPEGAIGRYAVSCVCRKPEPGLILQAAREHGIDPNRSWMVGDILHDVEAGRRAGCRTVLIHNGHETEWQLSPLRWPHYLAENMIQASQCILLAEHMEKRSQRDAECRREGPYAY